MKRKSRKLGNLEKKYQGVTRQIKRLYRSLTLCLLKSKRNGSRSGKTRTSSSSRQRRDWTGERMVTLIVWTFAVICIVLVVKALVLATCTAELLQIIERVWPYLLTLLGPIIHYYYSRRRDRN